MTTISFVVDGPPVPKARPRLGKHGTYTPEKTKAHEEAMGWAAKQAMSDAGIEGPLEGPLSASVVFDMEIPKSAPKKKRDAMHGRYHAVRPDADNLLKTLDSCNGIAFWDDAQIVSLRATKWWSKEPKTMVWIRSLS